MTHDRIAVINGLLSSLLLGVVVAWDRNPMLNWVKDGLGGRLDDIALGMVLAAIFVKWGDRRFRPALHAHSACSGSSIHRAGRLTFWSHRPVQLIGMMCYSLYVWHGVLIFPAGLWIPDSSNTQTIATYFVWLALVSALSYRYIEFGHVRSARTLFVPNAR